jgi:hypothetical protein
MQAVHRDRGLKRNLEVFQNSETFCDCTQGKRIEETFRGVPEFRDIL